MTNKGVFTSIFALLIFFVALLYTIVAINEKKILSGNKGAFSFDDELNLVTKNPIASFALLNRYGDTSILWNYLWAGVAMIPPLYIVGRIVYEKKEVA